MATSKWAMNKWEEDLRRKLRGPGVGNKTWWSLVKEKQGISGQNFIPPITKQDGAVATSSKEKTQLLVNLFTEKMKVEAAPVSSGAAVREDSHQGRGDADAS